MNANGATLEALRAKISARSARVGVIGLGYVGLPLAMAFASKGYRVTGIDADRRKIAGLSAGRSYILDVPSRAVKSALKKKFFGVTADLSAAAQLDAMIICVPTPLNKSNEPDISIVIGVANGIARYLKKGQLVVLESTTYPGTTEEVLLDALSRSGLKPEKDFFLAFSPERVDPGNKQFQTVTIPKVVGGIGPKSLSAARTLYGVVIKNIVEVSSAKTAEMVKLLENTFRSVNIGLINEIAKIAHRLKIDIWEVIEAAKTKPFGFMAFYPGPGTGGHCLPIDPLYLSWKSRKHKAPSPMIRLAAKINKSMPAYVVQRAAELLHRRKRSLKNASVLVMGAAYKRDVDDVRESPALHVMELLLKEGAKLSYADPFVPALKVGRVSLKSKALTPGFVGRQDCVIILTDHRSFDYALVARRGRLVLDTRNVMQKFKSHPDLFFL